MYGYLESKTFSHKASAALFQAVEAFAKEAIADVEKTIASARNQLIYLEKQLEASQSGWFGKSAKQKKLESDGLTLKENILELEENMLELKSLGVYRKLSVSQVQSMPNISIREKDKWGFYGHSTISHDYEKTSIYGDMVVIDHATGLMWHQSRSDEDLSWNKAKDWVRSLNSRGYADHYDWRLPTVGEAASLLESSKKIYKGYNKNASLYIDTVFRWAPSIWTGDDANVDISWMRAASVVGCLQQRWYVDFFEGRVSCFVTNSEKLYVLPVCSVNDTA